MAKEKTKADLKKEILVLNNDIRSLLGKNGAKNEILTRLSYNIIYKLESCNWNGEPIIKKGGKWGFKTNGIFNTISL